MNLPTIERVILRRASAALLACGLTLPTAGSLRADPLGASDPDLSVAAVRHWAECPLPKDSTCVIRKPVDTGYRILTAGAELDDRGDQWIADFRKLKNAASRELLLRVLSRNGELHEIVVKFPEEPLPPPKAKAKKKRRLSKPKAPANPPATS